jgi:hypothetical protein
MSAQTGGSQRGQDERRLPDGRLQSEAIIKEDHKQNLTDLKKMSELIQAVEADLDKSAGHVLSMRSLKQLEELEALSRRVRNRMRRF